MTTYLIIIKQKIWCFQEHILDVFACFIRTILKNNYPNIENG